MTVAELIERLKAYDPNAVIAIEDDRDWHPATDVDLYGTEVVIS